MIVTAHLASAIAADSVDRDQSWSQQAPCACSV